MDKLTHTTAEFDKAIRKVNKDYADVTEVDATASDVVSGKKIVGANKEIITGRIGTASLRSAVSIDGSVVGETVSPYEISSEASLKVTESGSVTTVITKSITSSATDKKGKLSLALLSDYFLNKSL